jgi:hypothetical protein
MTGDRLAISIVVALLALALTAAGCGVGKTDEKQSGKDDVRQAKPTKKIEHNRRPQAKGYGIKKVGEELLSANIKSVTGDVKLSARTGEPLTAAATGALIFGGGEVVTGDDATAEIALREIGVVTLDRKTRLLIPPHGECGAVLVRGALAIIGTMRIPKHPRCFLHTPATAIWSSRSNALVAVASDGRTSIGSLAGRNNHVDLLGRLEDIEEGQQIELGVDGKIVSRGPIATGEGPAEQRLRPWLEQTAAAQNKPEPWAKKQLDSASRIAKRLALDVDRLAELMEANKTLSKRRKELRSEPDASPDTLEQLTVDLTAQATEMVDLQIKGLLQICRIHGIVANVRDRVGKGSKQGDRIAEVTRGLHQQAQKLPPLFEKKSRMSAAAGRRFELSPSFGPPEQPL